MDKHELYSNAFDRTQRLKGDESLAGTVFLWPCAFEMGENGRQVGSYEAERYLVREPGFNSQKPYTSVEYGWMTIEEAVERFGANNLFLGIITTICNEHAKEFLSD